MAKAFTRLERILNLEKDQGYANRSVVGGMRQLATYWVEQAREEVTTEADKALVEQIGELLVEYDRLPGAGKRQEAVDKLLGKIEGVEMRQPQPAAKTAAKPVQPAPTAAKKAPPQPDKRQKKDRGSSKPARSRQSRSVKTPTLKIEASEPDADALKLPATTLSGVGPAIASHLAKLNIGTIEEVLRAFPRRYDDYTLMKPINRLQYGDQVTVIGTIWETRARRTRTGEIVQSVVSDGTGRVQLTWFNQPWLSSKLQAGKQIAIRGKVEQYLGRPAFNSPQWEELDAGMLQSRHIMPIYPLTEGLKQFKMRQISRQAVEKYSEKMADPLPVPIRDRNKMMRLPVAIQQTHYPDDQEALRQAQWRLMFDDLLLLQLGMLGQRRDWQKEKCEPIPVNRTVIERYLLSLPFTLTGAQERVIWEIGTDVGKDIPMNRLLQGDVGAGKTVVAAAAMLMAVKAGRQAAMMAPTEILAEQHFSSLSGMAASEGIEMALLTGSTPAAERARMLEGLHAGNIQILIGTHALIQEPAQFRRLALAVIDEQHRFGVDQRQALRQKGYKGSPHLLVMSATPIPRSLALSLYGDLDLSIIDEMPPGRQEIRTRWLRPSERERAYAFVRGQVEKGRQAFIICPLVEESEQIEAASAVEEHQRLQNEIFPDLKLGLLHGRMKSAEKERVMDDFYNNRLHMLVSTSVIEVGIDVPNSTVMLIEGANRFGLSQLHQFRGRVGRGESQSYCLLISDSTSASAEQRLQAMEQTNDGFILAERDLELRGPGQFFGKRQSGMPEVQLAALLNVKALDLARREAETIFKFDPMLEQAEHAALREKVADFWQDAGDVS